MEYCRELSYESAVDFLSEILKFRLVLPFLFLMIVPSSLDSDSEISDFSVDSFCSGLGIFSVDSIFELQDSVMHIKGNKRFLCNVLIFPDTSFLTL